MLRIELRGFPSSAYIFGVDDHSSVIELNGQYFLQGRFSLQVASFSSNPITFGSPSEFSPRVVPDNDRWYLTQALPGEFRFGRGFRCQPHADGPVLRGTTVRLEQLATFFPLLQLTDASISLLPNHGNPGAGRFAFPAPGGGTDTVALKPLYRDGKTGYFIVGVEGTLHLVFGGLLGDFNQLYIPLTHVDGVSLEIYHDCDASFLLEIPNIQQDLRPLKFDATNANARHRLVIERSTQLEVAGKDVRATPGATSLNVDLIEGGNGFLSATSFTSPEIRLTRLTEENVEASITPTMLYGPSARMRFHLPVARHRVDDFITHFAYLDTALYKPFDPDRVSRREPYYGLRISGLGCSKGGPVKFDAGVVRIALLPKVEDPNESRFEFQSGFPLSIAGCLNDDRFHLVPKPNRSEEWIRSVEIPANGMGLRITAEPLIAETISPLWLNTGIPERQLRLASPVLLGRPVGANSSTAPGQISRKVDGSPEENYELRRWNLTLRAEHPTLDFTITPQGVYPVVKQSGAEVDWTTAFITVPEPSYPLADYPGSSLSLDPITLRDVDISTEISYSESWEPATTKEKMVYSAISIVLTYKAIECVATSLDECLPDTSIKAGDINLKEKAPGNPAKRNGLNDLILVYYQNDAGFQRFVDRNVPRRPAGKVLWPFAMGLSVLLWEKGQYGTSIAKHRDQNAKPGLALDWSDLEAIDPPDFGWTPVTIAEMARMDPTLWPRASGRCGSRLDPTDGFWRGVVFRDLPLILPLPPAALQELEKLPVLKSLLDTINSHLMLRYGWKDNSGTTWKGGIVFSDPVELMWPLSWLGLISMKLKSFLTTGAESKFLSAEGEVDVSIPWATLQATGRVSFAFTGDTPTTRVVIENSSGFVDTTAVPGFTKAKLVRFFTDFRTAQVDIDLLPSPELAYAFPIFSANKAVRAIASYNFSGPPISEVTLLMPEEKTTRLFGKWPVVIQGMRLRFESGNLKALEITGRLGLGPGDFGSIGLVVELRKTEDDGWTMHVRPREVSADIGIGDYRLRGLLSWTDAAQTSGPVGKDELIEVAGQRDFWGLLQLDGSELLGSQRLFVRFGNRGGQNYWVGGLNFDQVPFGLAKLEKAMLILARDADLFLDGKYVVADALSDLKKDVVKLLRPDPGTERTWLTKWVPRPNMGSFVAGSGYFKFDDNLLNSPESDDSNGAPASRKYLTTLVMTNRGVVRVEAAGKFFNTLVLRFGIVIKPPTGFAAAITAPSMNYPNDSQPDFEFNGGQILLEVDYGRRPSFAFSMGWPPLTGTNPNDELERDWSQSLSVRWDDVVPINTYWGGFYVSYRPGELLANSNTTLSRVISLGVALRAGWTKKYEIGGDAAGGSADLGIAIGGVVELKYTHGLRAPLPLTGPNRTTALLESSRTLARRKLEYLANQRILSVPEVQELLTLQRTAATALGDVIATYDVELSGTVYADIWGKGSAQVFGVDVASIKIEGRARLHFEGSDQCRPMINRAYAYLGFDFEVKVGCKKFEAHGRVDFVFIDRPCRNTRLLCETEPGAQGPKQAKLVEAGDRVR